MAFKQVKHTVGMHSIYRPQAYNKGKHLLTFLHKQVRSLERPIPGVSGVPNTFSVRNRNPYPFSWPAMTIMPLS